MVQNPVVEEIDLVTTESDTSTSGDFVESEPEGEGELEPSDTNVLNEDPDDAWVQHKKTKVIHAIGGVGNLVSGSVHANGSSKTEPPDADIKLEGQLHCANSPMQWKRWSS